MSLAGSTYPRLALVALVAVVASPASAQDPDEAAGDGSIVERCTAPEHRHFDFWLGEWEVRNPDGELVGHNTISPAARGCGLLESWRGVRGGRGISVNTYDPDRGRWTQRWVGDGSALWLEGGWENGRMVLTGTAVRSTPRGAVLDRISWEPLGDGRVRQLWEVSRDDGASWEVIFNGLYSPRGAGTDPSGSEVGAEASRVGSPGGSDGPGAPEAVRILRTVDAFPWREASSGASVAAVHGDPARSGEFAFRMRMPPGFHMHPHFHHSPEFLTVVSGTLFMAFTPGGDAVELPPGSFVSIPAGTPMWGWTGEEEAVIQIHGYGPFRTTVIEDRSPEG